MNIQQALQAVKEIKESLKGLHVHPRCPPIEEWYPVRELEQAHCETLRRCIPFLNKILKEARGFVHTIDEKAIEKIHSRREYIQGQMEEARQSREAQNRKSKIITEIENLEKMNVLKFDRLVFDEEKSLCVIEQLFELNEATEGMSKLKNFVELTFEKEHSNRTDSYEKILELLRDE